MSGNLITIEGNLVDDVALRYTRAGDPVGNFRIAVNRQYEFNGETRNEVEYFTVVAWRTLGENVAASVGKGDRINVEGRLQNRKATLADGSTGYFTEIVATSVSVSLRWAMVDGITKNNARPSSSDKREAADANGLGDKVTAPAGGTDVILYGDEEPY